MPAPKGEAGDLYATLKIMVPRELSGEERAEWWGRATEVWPDYDVYQTKTDRQIALFVLEPIEHKGWLKYIGSMKGEKAAAADKRTIAEFVQDAATPEALADAVLPLLDADSEERKRMIRGFAKVRDRLGGPGASRRVAELAGELLGTRASGARHDATG